MANPSSEEEGILREWAPLTDFLQQIPLKAQKGIFTHDLSLTCVDTLPEFIAVGTNLGLIYWYDRRKNDLQRLRCENTTSSITCVKVISTVDYMVAAGNEEGIVTVFQIPKIPPDSIPESMKPKKNKQVERYTISGLHSSPVTAIEWSMNGMKLFSGDRNGLVVLTEIDFYMHLSKSMELLNEKYEIVQLSYSQQLLLVSTVYRSIVCHKDERWRVAQVGQKERKTLGKLGATFCLGSGHPKDVLVYSSRPGLRIWLADKTGFVQQTLIYKDALMSSHPTAPLINPAPVHLRQPRVDPQFGPLLPFKESLLVTYNSDVVYILNPATITVVATVADLRKVQGVAVNKEEIFILEGERSLIRVAYTPEVTTLTHGLKTSAWLCEATDELLTIMANPAICSMMADKNVPRKRIWKRVARELTEAGYFLGDNAGVQCRQKWASLLKSYYYYLHTNRFEKHSRFPPYFDEIKHILIKINEGHNLDLSNKVQGEVDSIPLQFEMQYTLDGKKCKRKKAKQLNQHRNYKVSKAEAQHNAIYTSSSPSLSLTCASSLSRNSSSDSDNIEIKEIMYSDGCTMPSCVHQEIHYVLMYPECTKNNTGSNVIQNFPDGTDELSNSYSLSDQSYSCNYEYCNDLNESSIDVSNFSSSSAREPISAKEKPVLLLKPSGRSPTVVIPSRLQSSRPIPTSGEALMTIVRNNYEKEKKEIKRYEQRTEERFNHLEALISQQNDLRKSLIEKSLLLLNKSDVSQVTRYDNMFFLGETDHESKILS